uniref:Uncharacterized protein n=1 Tax=Aromatoleum buckelii TaxID=200254 RepID=A0ABX1N000_9RHOO
MTAGTKCDAEPDSVLWHDDCSARLRATITRSPGSRSWIRAELNR